MAYNCSCVCVSGNDRQLSRKKNPVYDVRSVQFGPAFWCWRKLDGPEELLLLSLDACGSEEFCRSWYSWKHGTMHRFVWHSGQSMCGNVESTVLMIAFRATASIQFELTIFGFTPKNPSMRINGIPTEVAAQSRSWPNDRTMLWTCFDRYLPHNVLHEKSRAFIWNRFTCEFA